jgi:hypothetical protein
MVHASKITESGQAFLIKRRPEAGEDALLQLTTGFNAAIC